MKNYNVLELQSISEEDAMLLKEKIIENSIIAQRNASIFLHLSLDAFERDQKEWVEWCKKTIAEEFDNKKSYQYWSCVFSKSMKDEYPQGDFERTLVYKLPFKFGVHQIQRYSLVVNIYDDHIEMSLDDRASMNKFILRPICVQCPIDNETLVKDMWVSFQQICNDYIIKSNFINEN